MKNFEEFEQLLRSLAGDPEPGPDAFEMSEARLTEQIEKEMANGSKARRRPVLIAAATVLALVAVLLFGPIALQRSELRAATEQIARAAELVDPVSITESEFLFVVASRQDLGVLPAELFGDIPIGVDFVVALYPAVIEVWYGVGGTVQTRTVRNAPVFFSPEDENAYYAAGLDEVDQIGVAIVDTAVTPDPPRPWPDDADEIVELIRSEAASGRGLPEEVEQLEVALMLLRDVFATPHQRAVVLRWMGGLDGLELESHSENGLEVAMEYVDRGVPTRLTLGFDGDGFLISESLTILETDPAFGIPANTTVSSAHYTVPVVVPELDAP